MLILPIFFSDKVSKAIPFTVVECISADVPKQEPATLKLRSGDQVAADKVPQKHIVSKVSELEQSTQPYFLDFGRSNATPVHLPFTVQFTPTASSSGGAPVDNALLVDVKSATEHPFRLIPPSQYISSSDHASSGLDNSTSAQISPQINSDTVPIPAEEESTALPDSHTNGETKGETNNDLPRKKRHSSKKKRSKKDRRAKEPPVEPLPVPITGSRPFHHHDVWPGPPCSNPRALTRRGAFYHKSHPKLWWDESWGEKPADDAIVTVEDCLPPWAGGHPSTASGSDHTATVDKGTRARDLYEIDLSDSDEDESDELQSQATIYKKRPHEVDPEDEHPPPDQGVRPPEPRTGVSWNGFTKTIRAMAASVKGKGKDTSLNETSTSAGSSRSGRKRRRDEEDEESPSDSTDESMFWTMRKKAKRHARR